MVIPRMMNSTQGMATLLCEAQHNAMAIPCVEFIMGRITAALREV